MARTATSSDDTGSHEWTAPVGVAPGSVDCMAQVESLFTERHMIYGKVPEVSQTLVQVGALVDPSLKIEIKCVAVLG